MHFTLPILTILAGTAIAAPSSAEISKRDTQADMIKFAAAAEACDVFQCGGIIAAGVCILACRARPSVGCITGCVSDGLGSICPCVSCIPGLGDLVEDLGACPS